MAAYDRRSCCVLMQRTRLRVTIERLSGSTTSSTRFTNHRPYYAGRSLQQDSKIQTQVHPLGDFYADLLAVPIPKDSKASTDLPTFVDTGGDATKEERAAKLFGNIKGSGYERRTSQVPDGTWRTVNGVPIPPRPEEPDNCCMSGCVHCVWDDYRDDIEDWATRLREAQAKSIGRSDKVTPKVEMPRPELSSASGSMDDDGGGSETLWTSPSATANDDLFSGIPVGIREFMATEKRIRARKKTKSSDSTVAHSQSAAITNDALS